MEYPKCSTCQKARKWLEGRGIEFTSRNIKEEKPGREELVEWHRKSGLDLKRFFNTSGNLYKEMKLKDKLPQMDQDEKYDLLATDGMLVKRPIVVAGNTVLVAWYILSGVLIGRRQADMTFAGIIGSFAI